MGPEIIAVVALICLTAITVAVTVTSRSTVADVLLEIDRSDRRREKQVDVLMDRLMTINWESFAAVRALDDSEEEGGFFEPQTAEVAGDSEEGGQWGSLKGLRRKMTNEEQLLNEDFPTEGSAAR